VEQQALIEAITTRLKEDGFEVKEDEIHGQRVVVGRRARFHWTLTRLHIFVFLFDLARPAVANAEILVSAARDYAVANKPGLPPGWQTGLGSIPVLITPSNAGGVASWAVAKREQARLAVLDFPVVIDLPDKAVAYRTDTPVWGCGYFPQLRRIAREDIAPLVNETSGIDS
jgi:hypothetical protein